jgi:hypothetical protein
MAPSQVLSAFRPQQSASTCSIPGRYSRPRWRAARSGPHKGASKTALTDRELDLKRRAILSLISQPRRRWPFKGLGDRWTFEGKEFSHGGEQGELRHPPARRYSARTTIPPHRNGDSRALQTISTRLRSTERMSRADCHFNGPVATYVSRMMSYRKQTPASARLVALPNSGWKAEVN